MNIIEEDVLHRARVLLAKYYPKAKDGIDEVGNFSKPLEALMRKEVRNKAGYLDKWKAYYYGDNLGMSPTKIGQVTEALISFIDEHKSMSSPSKSDTWSDNVKMVKEAETIYARCRHFLSSPIFKDHQSWKDKPLTSKYNGEDAKYNLTGCAWDVYYMHYPTREEPMEPFLVRAFIKIEDQDKVLFYDLDKNEVGDLEGEYKFENQTVRFDVQNRYRHVHLKVNLYARKQEIALGTFNVSINDRIKIGRVLLERTDPDIGPAQVDIFSWFKDRAKYEAIDYRIRKFFSARKNNYQPLTNKVVTLNHFGHITKRWHQNARFLDPSKPRILIGFPVFADLGHDPAIFKDIRAVLNRKFYDNYDIAILPPRSQKVEAFEGYTYNDMREFKRCNIFLFFTNGVKKLSYAHIQLGFAIAYSKNVVIIGKYSDYSDTIRYLKHPSLKRHVLSEDTDLEEAWNSDTNELKRHLFKYIEEIQEINLTAASRTDIFRKKYNS